MKKVLAINSGSSSIKFKLFAFPKKEVVFSGSITQIGLEKGEIEYNFSENKKKISKKIKDHKQAVSELVKILKKEKVITSSKEIEMIGHRIVHGGEKFKKSVKANKEVVLKLNQIEDLAPLHNPHNIMGYHEFKKVFKGAKHVFVFDTSYHSTMLKDEFLYPLSYDYYEKYQIRRYGFHGTSHKYLCSKAKEYYNENKKIITLHVGNGVSLCAIKGGKSIATSMGFTPLSGVMMGTRSGDIDPSLITFLMEKENKSAFKIVEELNKKSGLLGVSQISSDSIELEKQYEKNNPKAVLAYDKMINTIAERIGSYFVKLEGLDAIVFSGGIGENSPLFRKLVVEKIKKAFDIKISKQKNEKTRAKFEKISTPLSLIDVLVIPTDEELVIASETYQILGEKNEKRK